MENNFNRAIFTRIPIKKRITVDNIIRDNPFRI